MHIASYSCDIMVGTDALFFALYIFVVSLLKCQVLVFADLDLMKRHVSLKIMRQVIGSSICRAVSKVLTHAHLRKRW